MRQFLIAIDQVANTIFGGMADETLSARAWRLEVERGRKWPRVLIDTLFFFDPNHCENSWRSEKMRSHLPKGYR